MFDIIGTTELWQQHFWIALFDYESAAKIFPSLTWIPMPASLPFRILPRLTPDSVTGSAAFTFGGGTSAIFSGGLALSWQVGDAIIAGNNRVFIGLIASKIGLEVVKSIALLKLALLLASALVLNPNLGTHIRRNIE